MAGYLALGDSYTIGEGVAPEHRWPAQLAHALRSEGIALDDPQIIATTGWTTDELQWGIDAAEPDAHWDLVSLMIGVNNQYRARSAVGYAGEFHTLLKRGIGFVQSRADRVMVLSIPDWGVTPFARRDARSAVSIAAEIDAFNEAAQQICTQEGVAFVDITPTSREHGAEPSMLTTDGLHPSGAMYALWTAQALPVARRLLSK